MATNNNSEIPSTIISCISHTHTHTLTMPAIFSKSTCRISLANDFQSLRKSWCTPFAFSLVIVCFLLCQHAPSLKRGKSNLFYRFTLIISFRFCNFPKNKIPFHLPRFSLSKAVYFPDVAIYLVVFFLSRSLSLVFQITEKM